MVDADCPNCGSTFSRIGNHWAQSGCGYPRISDHQREVLRGLVMGDGWVEGGGNENAVVRANMINKEYLEYIDDLFGVMGLGVSLYRTAEDCAKTCRESGFSPNAKEENYSDQYNWSSRRNPEFNELLEWYGDDGKVWPDNIRLTPTTLKHWFVCDGTFRTTQTNNHIVITLSNERHNKEKVERMFMMGAGVEVSRWDETEHDLGWYCSAVFSVEDSYKLFDYMGEPLPGFEYKWPEE